ncbi:MAG: hypothetical protein JO288_06315 [Hyphomicrobiales bacterium]|nr:hypothetical protein [Hyphomicrobiales bacterium]
MADPFFACSSTATVRLSFRRNTIKRNDFCQNRLTRRRRRDCAFSGRTGRLANRQGSASSKWIVKIFSHHGHSDFEAIRAKAGAAICRSDLMGRQGFTATAEDRRGELRQIVKGADAIRVREAIGGPGPIRLPEGALVIAVLLSVRNMDLDHSLSG